jgi:anaerobic nitric oxide reductase transcription regulator
VVLGSTTAVLPEDLPEAVLESSKDALPTKYYDAIKQAKKNLIQKALEEAQGNYTAAARVLGVHPNNLHRLIRTLNLKHE